MSDLMVNKKWIKERIKQKNEAAAANYQHQENNIINEIKSDLSRDSSHRAKQNAAIKYSDWFYNQHGHDYSLHNQKTCAQKTIDIVGIDVNTAAEIQYRVIRAYDIAEGILDARETIQQHHLTASSLINQQLTSQVQNLSISAPQVPTAESINSRYGSSDIVVYNSKEKKPAVGIPDYQRENKAMAEFLETVNTSGIPSGVRSIVFVNCDLKDHDLHKFAVALDNSYDWRYKSMDFDTFSFAGNKLGFPDRIFHLVQNINSHTSIKSGPALSIMHIDLSDNRGINDKTAWLVAQYLKEGYLPGLKALDVHGTSITKTGEGYFVEALENHNTQDIAITLEVYRDPRSAWESVKHAAKYVFDQHYKTVSNNHEAELLVYGDGDWSHCKKVMVDLSRSMSVGLIRQVTDKDTVQKIKAIKSKKDIAVVTGGIFTAVAKDSADAVFNADGAHCMAAINNFFGFHTITDTNPPHLGEFYDMDGSFYDIP